MVQATLHIEKERRFIARSLERDIDKSYFKTGGRGPQVISDYTKQLSYIICDALSTGQLMDLLGFIYQSFWRQEKTGYITSIIMGILMNEPSLKGKIDGCRILWN